MFLKRPLSWKDGRLAYNSGIDAAMIECTAEHTDTQRATHTQINTVGLCVCARAREALSLSTFPSNPVYLSGELSIFLSLFLAPYFSLCVSRSRSRPQVHAHAVTEREIRAQIDFLSPLSQIGSITLSGFPCGYSSSNSICNTPDSVYGAVSETALAPKLPLAREA